MFQTIYNSINGIHVWAVLVGLGVFGIMWFVQSAPCECNKEGPSWKMPD